MAQARAKSGGAGPVKKKDASGYAYKFKRVREEPIAREPGTKTRLEQRYRDEIVAKLQEEFKYTNSMQVPRVEKVVINIGLGEAMAGVLVRRRAVGDQHHGPAVPVKRG